MEFCNSSCGGKGFTARESCRERGDKMLEDESSGLSAGLLWVVRLAGITASSERVGMRCCTFQVPPPYFECGGGNAVHKQEADPFVWT